MEDHSKAEGCVFCAAQAQPDGPENLVAYRGKHSFVIMNLYPYTSGHLMVVPYAHKATLEDLDPATRGEMMELAARCMTVLREIYHPQGFNMGANIGEAAGAGILDHVHVHVVPRWVGDTNFMSSLAGTRVLPEIVQDTYERVRAAFQ
jgi:ATP adenylyltransferase